MFIGSAADAGVFVIVVRREYAVTADRNEKDSFFIDSVIVLDSYDVRTGSAF